VLGLDLAGEGSDGDRRWAYLVAGGRLLITRGSRPMAPYRPAAAGLHHLAFQVDTIDEVCAAEAWLREAGAAFAHDGVVPHGEAAGRRLLP
jgi:lactoylglutathione lyase